MTNTTQQQPKMDKKKRKRKEKDWDAEMALFDEEISMVAASTEGDMAQPSDSSNDNGEAKKWEEDITAATSKKSKRKRKMNEKELMQEMFAFDREVTAAFNPSAEDIPSNTVIPKDMTPSPAPVAVATVQAAPKMFLPQADVNQRMQSQQKESGSGTSTSSYYYQNDSYWQNYGPYDQHDMSSNVDYNALLAKGQQQQQQQPRSQPSQSQNQHQQGSDQKTGNQKTIKRAADGKTWEDPILAQFPENDFRLFVGNIGNDVTDDVLARAFQHLASFALARIVRDKKTGKSKGYGFVSLMDPNDFLKALDTMNGKYIGNRPCQLKRSKWADRNVDSSKSKKTKQLYYS